MATLTAREWGQQQARRSPPWSDERWHRISKLLGVALTPPRTGGAKRWGTSTPAASIGVPGSDASAEKIMDVTRQPS